MDKTACGRRCHVVRIGALGQVQRHQRLERLSLWAQRHDPVAIGGGVLGGHNRRNQVRHDNGAPDMTGAFTDDPGHHGPVTQVQMPVIRTAQCKAVDHSQRPSIVSPLLGKPVRGGNPHRADLPLKWGAGAARGASGALRLAVPVQPEGTVQAQSTRGLLTGAEHRPLAAVTASITLAT